MTKPKTNAQRVTAHRARQKALGITEVRGIVAPLACHAEIKAAAKAIIATSKNSFLGSDKASGDLPHASA